VPGVLDEVTHAAEPMKPAPPVTRNRLVVTKPSTCEWGSKCPEAREFGILV